jgi:hypothetical protein
MVRPRFLLQEASLLTHRASPALVRPVLQEATQAEGAALQYLQEAGEALQAVEGEHQFPPWSSQCQPQLRYTRSDRP